MPTYNPYQFYQQQFQQPYQQNPLMSNGQGTPQIQNGGFISVPSEDVARAWAVAPGNSVTFKNENEPYCYTKTMGFSQLDQPRFEKYRLVKEEDEDTKSTSQSVDKFNADMEELKDRVAKLERKLNKPKKEEEDE